MANIVLGVTGSISAYKAIDIANILTKKGHNVKCVLTDSACKFVTPLTLQTLTKNKVYTDMWDESNPQEVTHIALAEWADILLIAPATANTIAKLASGQADNLLTAMALAFTNMDKIAIACPAMNSNMYRNDITQRNLETINKTAFAIITPVVKRLACGKIDIGGLAKTKDILTVMDQAVESLGMRDLLAKIMGAESNEK